MSVVDDYVPVVDDSVYFVDDSVYVFRRRVLFVAFMLCSFVALYCPLTTKSSKLNLVVNARL